MAAVAVFVVTLVVVRRVRTLERYRYTFLFLGIIAVILPLLPGVGKTINGARLWVGFGPVNFQPGEAAKVLLVIFFAAYLVDKRELLASGTRRIGRMLIPDPKHLGPLFLAWAVEDGKPDAGTLLPMPSEKELRADFDKLAPVLAYGGNVKARSIDFQAARAIYADLLSRSKIKDTSKVAGDLWEEAIRLVASGRVNLQPLISRVLPLKQAAEALALACAKTGIVKVQIDLT